MAETVSAKAAFVALTGRPSAGKSTLVNYLCGAKVAITSPAPQTTRSAVRGILTKDAGQLVFVDTPGRYVSEKKLNKRLMEVSDRALGDADLVLYVIDAARAPGPEEEAVAERLAPFAGRTLAAVNKMDAPGADFARAAAFLEAKLPAVSPECRFQVSALRREGGEALVEALFRAAPAGEPFYPAECYTDQEIPFRVAEIIREKAMLRLREELPHAIYVETADTELRGDAGGGQTLWVRAFIITERESQKGMVVGKGGAMIKAIRLAALKELKSIFDWKIELDLRVKSSKDWRHNDTVLKRITG
ncbi:MAG: GTPase Era [Treponematales bacterium]